MRGNERSLGEWVTGKVLRGNYLFTKENLTEAFPEAGSDYLKNAVSRLVKRGMVVSPWRNFYVAVPEEYRLKGQVPPMFFIDGLMAYLGRPYYVGLLSAAFLHGAAHQVPQTFMVITEGKTLRQVEKKGTRIAFISRSEIPTKLLEKKRTQNGDVNVSSPALTAIDLIDHEGNFGGMSRASEVLAELMETVNFDGIAPEFYHVSQTPVYQRLGFMLEVILDEKRQADSLYEGCQQAGLKFRKTPLKKGKASVGCASETRWKIQVNATIEMDEL